MNYNSEDEEIFDEKVRQFMVAAGWDNLSKEELKQKVSETLEQLMAVGLVEQLVGEDGEFYYRSTKKAKQQRKSP